MQLRHLKILGVIGFLLCGSPLLAQNEPPQIHESLDVQVLTASKIVTGKIIKISGKPGSLDVQIAVGETLKGEPETEHLLRVSDNSDSRDIQNLFRKNKDARILVLGAKTISLDDKDLAIPVEDGRILHDPDQAIQYVRQLIRTQPDITPVKTFVVSAPHGTKLVVPVDVQLEKSAIETIQSKGPAWTIQDAIQALQFFKSARNISLLESLLNDPTSMQTATAESNNGVEVREYPIRKYAFDALKKWQVPVDPPVLREQIPRYDSVTRISWDGPVENDALEKLLSAGNLNDLVFNNKSLTDDQLSVIGRITSLTRLAIRSQQISSNGLKSLQGLYNLQSLDLSMCTIADADLKALAGLQLQRLILKGTSISDAGIRNVRQLTRLQELDLSWTPVTDTGLRELSGLLNLRRILLVGTRISDDGLATLNKLPRLKYAQLTLTQSTIDGLAQSRKVRPDLEIDRGYGVAFQTPEALAADAFLGNMKGVRRDLDEWHIDPNAADGGGTAAIFYAVGQNQYDIVKLLLNRKANVDRLDSGKNTPLHWATRHGYTDVMRLLLDHGANVNSADNEGNTALHFAAQNGGAEPVRLLLSCGADPLAKNHDGKSPLDLATENNVPSLYSLLTTRPSATGCK